MTSKFAQFLEMLNRYSFQSMRYFSDPQIVLKLWAASKGAASCFRRTLGMRGEDSSAINLFSSRGDRPGNGAAIKIKQRKQGIILRDEAHIFRTVRWARLSQASRRGYVMHSVSSRCTNCGDAAVDSDVEFRIPDTHASARNSSKNNVMTNVRRELASISVKVRILRDAVSAI